MNKHPTMMQFRSCKVPNQWV